MCLGKLVAWIVCRVSGVTGGVVFAKMSKGPLRDRTLGIACVSFVLDSESPSNFDGTTMVVISVLLDVSLLVSLGLFCDVVVVLIETYLEWVLFKPCLPP